MKRSKKIAEVLINLPVKDIVQTFSYLVPENLTVKIGSRVTVPFGTKLVREGFVMSLRDDDDRSEKKFALKKIQEVLDDEPWFSHEMMETAKELAQFYLCSLAEIMRLFIPGKGGRQLIRFQNWLVLKNFEFTDGWENNFKRSSAQKKLLEIFLKNKTREIPWSEATVSAAAIKALEEKNILVREKRRVFRNSYQKFLKTTQTFESVPLTEEQQKNFQVIEKFLNEKKFHPCLLHGVTGSGKTKIYIEAAKKVISLGRQAIILVPEIALTGQLVQSFQKEFQGKENLIVIHSALNVHERRDAFYKIRRREANIILGVRSALFVPVTDLGLIVLDEEQDTSYKQDEAPRYHAKVVAEILAKRHNATLIFGSATPSLESFYLAQQNKLTYFSMKHRVGNIPLPKIFSVDMREELRAKNFHVLSRAMQKFIQEALNKKEQIILMLNRRGFATFVMCRSCGHVMKCPQCQLPLVYHKNSSGEYLSCHHCEFHCAVPKICPKCQSHAVKFFGSGTEKLEHELREFFPKAKIIRFDRDTTRTKFSHETILQAFREKKFDILLGTQMISKGHDMHGVTSVGILSADSVLHFPYFRAAEQCFDLILQTAGRAGRGELPGRVLVQCYTPEHYCVQAALAQDYQKFFEQEIQFRKLFLFPPFSRLIKLYFLHKNEEKAQANALAFKEKFLQVFPRSDIIQIEGPAAPFIAFAREQYRFCLLIKTKNLAPIQNFLRQENLHIRSDVWIDIDPIF